MYYLFDFRYLKLDVILLGEVFQEFRSFCLKYYGLEPLWYYGSPGLSQAACLKFTNAKCELITDTDKLLWWETAVRGGFSGVIHRHSVANNKYMGEKYDKEKESKYILYTDVTNLYGYCMTQPLPCGKLQWMKHEELVELEKHIMDYQRESEWGYFLEIDCHIPDYLHPMLPDFPPLPEKMIVTNDMLSPYQLQLQEQYGLKSDKTEKLLTTLLPKKNYKVIYFM